MDMLYFFYFTYSLNTMMKIWIDLDNTPHVPFFKPIITGIGKKGAPLYCSNSHYDPSLSDFRLLGSNDPAFRRMRPAFQHEIEQMLPVILGSVIN